MAKAKLIVPPRDEIYSADGEVIGSTAPKSPQITGVRPVGSGVLVEFLTPQELANTHIHVGDKTDLKVPMQGYIVSVGPTYRKEDWGFGVGDRVLISGVGVMAPTYDDSPRHRMFMEPPSIRAVLLEAQ